MGSIWGEEEEGKRREEEKEKEMRLTKKKNPEKRKKNSNKKNFTTLHTPVTSADEVYSQAHVDSLGTHYQPWELFVDGYDLATGRRIYDASRGHTCHQCRQKTLGTHTACDCCGRLSGIFCGDCLFMRYGENVREANAAREAARARRAARAAAAAGAGAGASSSGGGSENGNENEQQQDFGWACPPCRGLCNCSFHRARRGWAPTGSLYRHALAEGYASVAHFLVLTSVEEGVVVPPGLRQGKRQEEEGGNGNTAAALPSTRPVSAAAGLLRDPPVTTTVARGGKPKASSSKSNAVKSPGSPPLPSAKRAEATRRRSLGTSSSSPNRQQQQQQQLTSPTLEPAPVAVVPSLLPNGKRRTGSFMSQLRLNPEALKRRRGGAAAANRGKATATAKTPASASAAEKKKKPAAKKAAVSISPRAPGMSRRSIRGSVGVEVAAAC